MNTTQRLKELSRPTGEEDLMRVEYPEPRWTVAPKQAAIVVAVVIVVCGAVFGASALRGGAADPVAPAPQWNESETPPPDDAELIVAVVGAVAQPGLVTVAPGARVADALEQAQPLPEADLASVNLAQPLVDGQQITVLAQGQAPEAPELGVAGASAGISLNGATPQQLTELPGVGEATAAAIVAHRDTQGPFTSVEQLMDVKGIGPAKFDAIKDLVTL